MKKLFGLLKKSTFTIIFVVVLLAVQAMCDLSLPSYTSNIVNVGIQQGGVESNIPQVIRTSEMNKISLFLNNKEDVLNSYKLLDKDQISEGEYEAELTKYPILKNEDLYVLKDNLSEEELNTLKDDISLPIVMVNTLSSDKQIANGVMEKLKANMPAGAISDSTTVFDVFSMMPKEQVNNITNQFSEKFEQMDSSTIEQLGISFVRSEYETIGIDMDKTQTNYVISAGLKMLLLALVAMIATVGVTLLASRIAAKYGRDLRKAVFRKVMKFSNKELDEFSTASLITRCTNDIQQIQQLAVMSLRMVFYAPIIGIGAFIKVSHTGNSMSWVIGIAIISILCLVGVLLFIAMPKFQIVQKLVDKLNLVAREIITGLPVIRAFTTEKHEEERFDKANKDLTKTNLFVNRVMTIMMPTMMFIMNGISVLIVWVGASKIDAGIMQVGDLMAFIQYTMQIIMAFLMLSMMSIILPRAWVSMKRIGEVLDKEISIEDSKDPEEFDKNKKGYIEFENVTFSYPDADEEILSNISFTAKPGETTAFIGSTGSGKSTLINLIPRFYDVIKGSIFVNGVDVRNVRLHDLREKIGYVPQKGMLFSGTIESNIAYGNEEANKSEIIEAANVAQAVEFIETKPEKYESHISQGGNNVSGGQKQRLSIARAIAIDPDIYIFDDSFSALDYKTDVTLRKSLRNATGDSTILIVAQRISTVISADQIIVLDEGKIVGHGTHKELLKSCDVYQQIALSQLSKEELENE